MRPETLRHRVLIQARGTAQDDYGQPIETWTNVTPTAIRAEVKDVSGREYFSAQATQNVVQTKIRIRYRADVTASMRVVHGADVYNIEAVLTEGNRESLLLMCSKGLSDG